MTSKHKAPNAGATAQGAEKNKPNVVIFYKIHSVVNRFSPEFCAFIHWVIRWLSLVSAGGAR